MSVNLLEVGHTPDILDCLSQLSNDQVPTPPKTANRMLDLLPNYVWTRPDFRWLDPGSKSGVFLREIAGRLLIGLAQWEPDVEKRAEHIYRNMIFGSAVTELMGEMSRRSLYCSRDASGEHAVIRFDDRQGNVPFVPTNHTTIDDGACTFCGAPAGIERGTSRENYAYSFIHGTYPTQELKDMKFDVIVGNPPYQISSDGNTRTRPIYNLFVEQAISMDPKHILMITPSRWFAGGLGLDGFRSRMLADHRLKTVVDFPQSKDCFPGVKIRGGVNYFLWSQEHNDGCTVQTVRGNRFGATKSRFLDDYDVFVRFNEGVDILEKVVAKNEKTMDGAVSSLVPFGIRAKFRDYVAADFEGAVALHVMGRKIEWIDSSSVTNNSDWIDKHKTLLHAAYGEDHEGPFAVIASPIVAEPKSACTETYLVIGTFDDASGARNLAAYLRTKFVRFLVWLRMNTQHVSKDRFAFVPALEMTTEWTDQLLYERYGLNEDEIAFIESQIKEMPGPSEATA